MVKSKQNETPVIDIDDKEVNEQDKPFEKKKRKRTSVVWKEFQEIILPDGTKKAECVYCKHRLTVNDKGATTQFHRHLKICPRRQLSDKRQNVLSMNRFGSGGEGSVTNFKYEHARVREAAAHMVLVHEYPFNMMEHELFNEFMITVTPYYQKISRTTVKNDCMATYELEKKKLKGILKDVNRVSLTGDCWKSGQQVGYMVLTCHFIDSEWKLQKRILSFCDVPPPHTGLIISDAVSKCLIDWGIENKVSTITFDNATNNDAAVRILKDNFSLKGRLFLGGKIFHVRCCAHILNLIVHDGLNEISSVIENIRESVKYLKASEARLIKFAEIVKQLQLPETKLILDVPTRWNSTYAMLATAIKFKAVFPRYHDRDPSYRWLPSFVDWERAEEVCKFLEVFEDVTNIISGSDYPTSNLFLTEIWRIKQVLDQKATDKNIYIRAMAAKMKEKFDKYWGECNFLMAIGAILDPRYKMKLIEFCFPKIYNENEAFEHITSIREALCELFNDYVANHSSSSNIEILSMDSQGGDSSNIGIGTSKGNSKASGRNEFDLFIRVTENIQPAKSDLDIYLEEGVFICSGNSTSHFDALEWWKANNLKFRILSKMASDILSIPITTVASESAFSAGGRVIDPYRSSLSTKTVQALVCGSDWVRNLYGIKKSAKSETDIEAEIETIIELPVPK